jgi:hypothetical protein
MEVNIFIAYTGRFTGRQMWNKYESYNEVIEFFSEMSKTECNDTMIEMCVIHGKEREDIKTISDLLDFANKNLTI